MTEKRESKKRVWTDFDCPECTAHNVVDGFSIGDDVFCSWCGQVFLVKKSPEESEFRLQLN